MKANQAFKANEEAVSPVIGVILMVAITVVLAAVVFVLVTKLSNNNSTSAPTLSFSTDSVADRLTLTAASTGADWSRVTVAATSCTANTPATDVIKIGSTTTDHHNVAATKTATGALAVSTPNPTCTAAFTPIQVAPASATSVMAAGDFLSFCVGQAAVNTAGGGAATNVVISLVDSVANSQIGQYTFTSVAVCA
ncbi:MAG: type IV pilin [Thermoplasmatota archaeon]